MGPSFLPKRKRRVPWLANPRLAARNARLRRLKRKGLTPPDGKAAARALCVEAAATLPVRND